MQTDTTSMHWLPACLLLGPRAPCACALHLAAAQAPSPACPQPAIGLPELAVFSFLYFLKNKNFKNICPFWNISKISPGRPHRATGPKCNFFSSNSQRGPWQKKGACRPPPRATGACRPPLGRQGPVARWGGRQGPLPPIHRMPPFPLSFEPKNSGKKRGVRRRKAAKLCRIAYLWSTGNFRMNPLILYKNLI